MRPYDPRPIPQQVPNQESMIEQFRLLDSQNKQLIRMAELVQRSSFMNHGPHPQAIHFLEEDLRKNLAAFIENIRNFFLDMDKRLRALGHILQHQQYLNQNAQRQSTILPHNIRQGFQKGRDQSSYHRNNQRQQYNELIQRISSLESNLKHSQQNETRLISIIEKIQRRAEQQPSSFLKQLRDQKGIQQTQILKKHISRSQISNRFERENRFRLFTLQSTSARQQQSFTRHTNKLSSVAPFNCISKRDKHLQLQNSNLISSSIPMTFQSNYTSNEQHRVNFMMRTLND